jgi:hypothetical protein
MHMHAAVFGAAMQAGHRLAGIEQAALVEGCLDAVEGLQFRRFVLHAHLVDLLDTDAVLAGDRAAERHRQFQDFGAEGFGPLPFAGLGGVVHDQRMQVAVAGVEDIGAAQAVFRSIAMAASISASRLRGMVPSMQ